jgi:hypothetical protein
MWREPAPGLRPASRSLDIPLRPSPLARRAAGLFVLAQVLYLLELVLLGRLLPALLAVGLAAGSAWLCLRPPRGAACTPRRLLLAADGRWHLLTVSGTLEQLALQPASLRLGRWLLLMFQTGDRRTHRLLLGPDNLDPAQLAALQRRLGAPESRSEGALYGGR